MPGPTGPVLRVEPHTLPDLIAAYQQAFDRADDVTSTILRRGKVPAPWTNDPHTKAIHWAFNQWAVDAPDSAYQAMLKYQAELFDVLTALKQMQTDYQRTESGIADDLSRM